MPSGQVTNSYYSKVLVVLDYISQLISLFILSLSVSLLTISLHCKSFISIGLDLILVLSVYKFLFLLHLIILPLFLCLFIYLLKDFISISRLLESQQILILLRIRCSSFLNQAFRIYSYIQQHLKTLTRYLERPYKAFRKGLDAYRNSIPSID